MNVGRLAGSNVRRLRLSTGMTQEQFAKRSGFIQQHVSDLERAGGAILLSMAAWTG